MRSRYTAYTQANMDYIQHTMRDSALANFDAKDAKTWAKSVKWLRLEVIKSSVNGDDGHVEFKAYYSYQHKVSILHENSQFRREEGKWYYIGEA